MANIYVNLTEAAGGVLTNGYGYGDDARDRATAASKSTPVATLTRANAVSQASDIIILNDGTYEEATFVSIVNTGMTIQAENSRQTIIQNASAGSRVIHTTAADVTLNGVILDAQNTQTGCFTFGTGTGLNLTLVGGGFLNPTANFITATRMGNVTMSGGWTASATSLSERGFVFSYSIALASAGTVSMSDGTITIGDSTGASDANRRAIHVVSNDLAGVSCEIYDMTFDLSIGTAANSQTAIYITDMESVKVYNNTITFNDSLVGTGILCDVSAIDNTDVINIYGNTVAGASGATGGIGIQCGSDSNTSPTGVGSLKSAQVYNNVVTNTNHGVLIGWITGATIYGNKTTGNVLGVILKGTTDCYSGGNVVIDCTGSGALRFKGDTNSIHANNLVIYNSGASVASAIPLYADDITAVVNTTGAAFYNNCVYANETITDWVVVLNALDTCTFNSNNYFADTGGGVSLNPYNYQGTPYATLALWNGAATVSNETETDPEIVDIAGGNYHVASSSLVATGFNWGDMHKVTGFDGEPFPAFDIDIGAVQGTDATNHPFHPLNL
ncbi:MAG: hypothetical protein OEX12_07010 [Gammaproteobacteria bacterium]|nr:hypothetical protein [Gammaproteobacteria bacterium]